jgi:gliding motility-associated-like protein
VHQLPIIYLGNNDTIAKGKSYQLEAGGAVSYSWSPSYALSNTGIFNPKANPEVTTTYIVSATDIFGCTDTSSITIFVQSNEYWIPKAFSPDGNSKNDILFVRGDDIEEFEFVIFNNSGEMLYHSIIQSEGWNGTKQSTGELVPEGVYVFFVKGKKIDGTLINDNGLVNLLR